MTNEKPTGGSAMGRPGSTRARLIATGLLLWPLLPVLTIWPGAWLGKGAATLAFLVMLGPGALWCLVGLAVSLALGLIGRRADSSRPAWIRRAPWVGAALNGAALLGWVVLMFSGLLGC
jgi:hypothetical protein